MGSDFQQLMTQAKRKKEKDQSQLDYFIFDGMPLKNWMDQKSKNYVARKTLLEAMAEGAVVKKIQLTPYQLACNPGELDQHYEYWVSLGLEGVIIKQDTEYAFKRTRNWMKRKPVEQYDCVVIDVVAGEKGKRWEDTLGALWVEFNGVKTQVGTGYSDELRDEIWDNPNDYIGKMVEIEGEKELTKDGCIRFPRFSKFRPDLD